MISTYHHSWFLRSNGKRTVWVSEAVDADACGVAEGTVLKPEVCPLDFLNLYLM